MNFSGPGRSDGGGSMGSGGCARMSQSIMSGVFGGGGEEESGEISISGESGVRGVESPEGGELAGISGRCPFSSDAAKLGR